MPRTPEETRRALMEIEAREAARRECKRHMWRMPFDGAAYVECVHCGQRDEDM